jgi:hypothetical protein
MVVVVVVVHGGGGGGGGVLGVGGVGKSTNCPLPNDHNSNKHVHVTAAKVIKNEGSAVVVPDIRKMVLSRKLTIGDVSQVFYW